MFIIIQRLRRFLTYCTMLPLILMTHPALAALPKLPDGWYAKDDNWFKVAGTVGKNAATYAQFFLGAALLSTVLMGVLRGYRIAQERQEMSHFFRAISVGIVCLTVGGILIYAITAIPTPTE